MLILGLFILISSILFSLSMLVENKSEDFKIGYRLFDSYRDNSGSLKMVIESDIPNDFECVVSSHTEYDENLNKISSGMNHPQLIDGKSTKEFIIRDGEYHYIDSGDIIAFKDVYGVSYRYLCASPSLILNGDFSKVF